VRREANSTAHVLVKVVVLYVRNSIWSEEAPPNVIILFLGSPLSLCNKTSIFVKKNYNKKVHLDYCTISVMITTKWN
jgi:hypothetical protein